MFIIVQSLNCYHRYTILGCHFTNNCKHCANNDFRHIFDLHNCIRHVQGTMKINMRKKIDIATDIMQIEHQNDT